MDFLRTIVVSVLLFCVTAPGMGQSVEKSAFKNIQKEKWAKAESSLRKSLQKDSINSLARYLMALSFFKSDNPHYQLDSAYRYSLQSLADYRISSDRERARLKRFPFDSTRIIVLRQRIDSVAFQNTMHLNTEAGYIAFLQKHPFDLVHRGQAIELRNEVAYQDAIKENTYQALLRFMNKYPDAVRLAEARVRYDRLLYESLTQDRRLSTFETFLADHPDTPFRLEVEQNIFDLSTLPGDEKSLLNYMRRYPKAAHVKKARNILFHVLLERNTTDWPDGFLTDSLVNVIKLQQSYILPFLKSGRFGFMNVDGLQVMKPELPEIPEEYICEYFTDDFIVLDDKILTRDGKTIFAGILESVDDIGKGFLKIKSNGCYAVVHKSGFVANPCATDAKILNQFIAFKNDSVWSLHALSGRKLFHETFDDVSVIGKVFALERGDYVHLTTTEKILRAAESQSRLETDSVEEAKVFESTLIWIKNAQGEGIIDQNLKEIIPTSPQQLSSSSFGVIGKTETGFNLYSLSNKHASTFEHVVDKRPWLTVQKDGQWFVLDPVTFTIESAGYDSVSFLGPMLLGSKHDSLSIHFSKSIIHKFARPVDTHFLPGKDSTSFLVLVKDNKKSLYGSSGKLLFPFSYDQIQHAGRNFFIVTKNEKKGLLGVDGKVILPTEYDAIGSLNGNTISLLKNQRFGLYHVGAKKLIKPQFEKNVLPLPLSTFLAFKDGGYGFVTSEGKPVGKFEYNEILGWNDSSTWVKQNSLWSLIDLRSKRHLMEGVSEIKFISDSPDEKVAVVKRENAYGVLSNTRGTVVPVSFSDLVNLGPADDPIYFTEKHVEEASIFVVIYYNANGKLIRREVYDDADEYEKIYCSDN